MYGREKMSMEDKMEVSAKDMKEVKALHDKIMMLADKYDMSMEDLIQKCCHDMEEDSMEEDEGEREGVDKMKVKLILGKLGPKGEE